MPILRVTTRTGSQYVVDTFAKTWHIVNSTNRDWEFETDHGEINHLFDPKVGQPMTLVGPANKLIITSVITNIVGPGYGKRDYSI